LAKASKPKEVVITPLNEEISETMSKILDSFNSDVGDLGENFVPIQATSLKPKLVRVQILRKFKSIVGKTWYYGEKDRTMLVPDFVADFWMTDTKRPKIKIIE
jgi:hypothetical protein